MTYTVFFSPYIYKTNFFTLRIQLCSSFTTIDMEFLTPIINTVDLPHTKKILKKHLPTVLESKCFNTDYLPFSQEVKRTEIGHLFEHILLEYLCFSKLDHGFKKASYSGETSWNWRLENRGIFHISIDVGKTDATIFFGALKPTVDLINKILIPSPTRPLPERVSYHSQALVAA